MVVTSLNSLESRRKEGAVTQLRIRRKAEPDQRPNMTLVPMAAILAAGIATTFFLDAGKMATTEVVEAAAPRLGAAFETLQLTYLKTQTLTMNGKDWVLAAHPAVYHFLPEEMATTGQAHGWNLVVNTSRGLPALSRKPSGYDRLYVDLGNHRYAPLRWRHVP
jgi:hypothetical protein